MFNIRQTNDLLKYALMFCYYNKELLSALELVLYEFDANKKCQVSLVIKYRYDCYHSLENVNLA